MGEFQSRTVFLDSGPLLLLVVGLTGRQMIRKHKRTERYTEDEFDRLSEVLERYPRRLTTPGVLSEVSNHLDHHGEPERTRLRATLGRVIESLIEVYHPSRDLKGTEEFLRLGLTDSSLFSLGEKPHVVTTDGLLCQALLQKGYEAVVFPPSHSLSAFET